MLAGHAFHEGDQREEPGPAEVGRDTWRVVPGPADVLDEPGDLVSGGEPRLGLGDDGDPVQADHDGNEHRAEHDRVVFAQAESEDEGEREQPGPGEGRRGQHGDEPEAVHPVQVDAAERDQEHGKTARREQAQRAGEQPAWRRAGQPARGRLRWRRDLGHLPVWGCHAHRASASGIRGQRPRPRPGEDAPQARRHQQGHEHLAGEYRHAGADDSQQPGQRERKAEHQNTADPLDQRDQRCPALRAQRAQIDLGHAPWQRRDREQFEDQRAVCRVAAAEQAKRPRREQHHGDGQRHQDQHRPAQRRTAVDRERGRLERALHRQRGRHVDGEQIKRRTDDPRHVEIGVHTRADADGHQHRDQGGGREHTQSAGVIPGEEPADLPARRRPQAAVSRVWRGTSLLKISILISGSEMATGSIQET